MRRPVAHVTQIAVLLAGAVALIGPARAEWSALEGLREGMSRCGKNRTDVSICGGVARADIDIDGLRLSHPWHERAGMHMEADEVTVSIDLDGMVVDATGLRVARLPSAPAPEKAPAAAPEDERSDAPAATEPASPPRSTFDTHGIPVHVRVHGPATLSHAGLTATLDAPELLLDGHGNALARFGLQAEGRGLEVEGLEPFEARAVDGNPRRWRATGPLSIGGGYPLASTLTVGPDALEARFLDDGGGQLEVRLQAELGVDVRAEGFALGGIGRMGARTLAQAGVDVAGAMMDADLRVEEHGSLRTAHIEHLSVGGLVVDHRKLARTATTFDELQLQGDVSWDGEALDTEMWIAHRDAELSMSVHLDDDVLDLEAALAPLPCQALIGSLPDAMSDMVSGTKVDGQLDAHARLVLDRRALDDAREHPQEPIEAMGELSLHFPFLERCTVVSDDPRLDLPGLSGPYRHRLVDHNGRHQVRLLAKGGPGYVSLAEAPLIARAFVTLEDRRFWHHDGFDREQIEHALWHNLVKGRVSRGASTISQQAARNLWLGVDRSWGRKLQEALLTSRLEATTAKPRIMELYLNVIELGPGTHGVEEAAQLYFGKSASSLSVIQAVHLAAMAPAPNRFAKDFESGHVDREWRAKLRDHVRRMHRAGHITRGQMDRALRADLRLLDRRG